MLLVTMHLCADIADEIYQGRAALSAAQVREFAAQRREILLEGPQALHEPPSRAATRLKLAFLLRSPHEHWYLQACRQANAWALYGVFTAACDLHTSSAHTGDTSRAGCASRQPYRLGGVRLGGAWG